MSDMKETLACPVCGEDGLAIESFDRNIAYGDRKITVHGLERCRCLVCDADPVLPDQIRHNQLITADTKRRLDNLYLSAEIRSLRDELGLSQSEAAVIFGGGANAFSKYERGDVVQSVPMDRLLKITSRYPSLVSDLMQIAGIELKPLVVGIRDALEMAVDFGWDEVDAIAVKRYPLLAVASASSNDDVLEGSKGKWGKPIAYERKIAVAG
ncbi:MAG TPA: type II toxin-antitoxin system MqsA family antitoxin [Steroidobacteraceae bacterium]|nr:type II toxin-antitoxin system MqsA family antitoxin [Steroidobacteraceae bacterium]